MTVMVEPRRAPVQSERNRPAGTVLWEEHEKAWRAYSVRYGKDQSAERIAERGGFGYDEITKLLKHPPLTWESHERSLNIEAREQQARREGALAMALVVRGAIKLLPDDVRGAVYAVCRRTHGHCWCGAHIAELMEQEG